MLVVAVVAVTVVIPGYVTVNIAVLLASAV